MNAENLWIAALSEIENNINQVGFNVYIKDIVERYNLKDDNLKRQIASNYKCSLKVFSNYIETIRVIRNTCAHGACVYNLSLAKGIKSTPLVPISEAKRHNISGVIDVIRHMIGCISVNRLEQMNDEIISLLRKDRSEKTANIITNCTGFAEK